MRGRDGGHGEQGGGNGMGDAQFMSADEGCAPWFEKGGGLAGRECTRGRGGERGGRGGCGCGHIRVGYGDGRALGASVCSSALLEYGGGCTGRSAGQKSKGWAHPWYIGSDAAARRLGMEGPGPKAKGGRRASGYCVGGLCIPLSPISISLIR